MITEEEIIEEMLSALRVRARWHLARRRAVPNVTLLAIRSVCAVLDLDERRVIAEIRREFR